MAAEFGESIEVAAKVKVKLADVPFWGAVDASLFLSYFNEQYTYTPRQLNLFLKYAWTL
jgi:hypothetical protein